MIILIIVVNVSYSSQMINIEGHHIVWITIIIYQFKEFKWQSFIKRYNTIFSRIQHNRLENFTLKYTSIVFIAL